MFRKRTGIRVTIPNHMSRKDRRAFRRAGVVIGKLDKENSSFVHVTLPEGWRYVESGETHGGLSHILDAKGRQRALINCCADANTDAKDMTIALSRFTYDDEPSVGDATTRIQVLDCNNVDGAEVVFTTRSYYDPEQAVAEAKAWLRRNHRRWRNASAYWD